MVKLLALLVVLAVALSFGDVATRHYAERQLAARVRSKVSASSVHVTMSSFPFVGRLAASGTVRSVRVDAKGVSGGGYTFDAVEVVVHDVRVDRNLLVRHQQVRLVGIKSGTVTADLGAGEVDRAVAAVLPDAHVTIGDGTVQARVAGVRLVGHVAIVAGRLRFSAAGFDVNIPIPELPLLPCVAGATLLPGRLRLSCTFNQVPAALLATAGA